MTTLEPISCPLCHGLGYTPKQCRNPECPIDRKPAPVSHLTLQQAKKAATAEKRRWRGVGLR